MNVFTCVGFYPSTGQRFMDSVEAASAEAAEDSIEAANPGVTVCGVIAGNHQAADTVRATINE